MKISKRDKQILLIFLGIILGFVSYYFVFLPAQEKITVLKAENQKLETKVRELEQLDAKKEVYEAETAVMVEQIDDIYSHFQTDFRSEDAFIFGRTVEETADNTQIASINIGNQELVFEPVVPSTEPETTPKPDAASETAADVPQPAADAGTQAEAVSQTGPVLYRKMIELSHTCTAQGLKDIIDFVILNTEKMAIESLSVTFDTTTGTLLGNTQVNVYLLQGTNKPYVPWNIPKVNTGTDNVFGTLVLPSNVSDNDADTEAEEAEAQEEE